MGRTTDSWRTAETWIRCLPSHSVPLYATAGLSAHPDVAHLPAEPGIWDRYDRSWRSKSAISRASCSRRWIARVIRCVTKVRDGIPCRLIEPSSTLHRLRPYRSSNRTDRRAVHGPPRPTTLGGDNWTMSCRRLHHIGRGRHRAGSCRPSQILHDHRYRAQAPSESQFLQCDCIARLPRTTPSKKRWHAASHPESIRTASSRIPRMKLE
jgi:hypothetical protein